MDVSIPPPSGQRQRPVAYEFGVFRLEPAEQRLIYDGKPFPLPKRAFEMLVFLVERSGHLVTKEEMLEALWPGLFVEEGNLAQNVFLLRRALTNGASGHDYIETVPRRGYRFIAPVKAILPEPATPPAVVPSRPSEAPVPAPVSRPRRPAFVAVAAALLLAAASIWLLRPPAAARIRSIAILPLKSLDATADQPLGLGLAEAVVSRLSRDPDLLVRPLSSSRQAALAAPDAAAAGARLNVEGVLEGTLQRADGRIRATIQLVRVADRRVLWSGSFEEGESEAFLLEDSIADRLVRALGVTSSLSGKEASRPVPSNRAAYEAYLRGRYFWNRRDTEDLQKSVVEFEEAIRQDPSYALAYSGLADAHLLLGPGGPPESFPKARAAAERALALDPELAEAHASLGFVRFFADWDFAGSERELRRALQLNPGYVTAHDWYAYWLTAAGHPARAIAEIRRAREIDPTSLVANRDVGHILLYSRRYEEAIEQLRRTLAMDPGFNQTRFYLIEALTHAGRFGEAAAELQGLPQPHDVLSFRFQEASIEARAGRPQRLRALLSSQGEGRDATVVGIAWLHGVLGDYDRAFEILERAYRSRDFYLVFLNADPGFDSLRSDPRFAELVHRIGIPSS
jgi:DNA-binding winged helix-turn-helix (wHTH) protein/TolB-like protein/Tfp pilus assembly protein PilF